MEAKGNIKERPARRVSSNFCEKYITREIKFRLKRGKSFEKGVKTRLKYNRGIFSRTKDQLTEMCLRVLLERRDVQEKLIVESLEPVDGNPESKITISHKIKIPPKDETLNHFVEVKCLTSWVRWEKESKEKHIPDNEPNVPLNNVFQEDKFVLQKLRARLATRKELFATGNKLLVWLNGGGESTAKFALKIRLFEVGEENEESPWQLIPEGHSYDAILPHFEIYRTEFHREDPIFWGPPGGIFKAIELMVRAERPQVYYQPMGKNRRL